MDVYGYDPYLSVESAWKISRGIHHARTVDEIYSECDYITIHVPALDTTTGMIDADAIGLMKGGVVVLNFARDVLLNSEAVVDGLVSGKIKHYVTDFPTPEIAGVKGAIVIPHLGASTAEAEENCAKMVSKRCVLSEYGNIKNSVNYPNCDMGYPGDNKRITLSPQYSEYDRSDYRGSAKDNMNIADMSNKSKGSYAYTMIDDSGHSGICEARSEAIDGILSCTYFELVCNYNKMTVLQNCYDYLN